jgi:hypothetical protein
MPILTLECPACGHVFKGMFLASTKPPEKWICSQCHGDNARPLEGAIVEAHPLDRDHGFGRCACCG